MDAICNVCKVIEKNDSNYIFLKKDSEYDENRYDSSSHRDQRHSHSSTPLDTRNHNDNYNSQGIESFNKDLNKMKKAKLPFFRPVFYFFYLPSGPLD
jgi:hypothetical protein